LNSLSSAALRKILRRCPTRRQTLLLSATLPPPVLRLAHRYMVDPVHINLSPAKVTVENIRQSYLPRRLSSSSVALALS
jgi:ATP-dependent RNA helicase DeaD